MTAASPSKITGTTQQNRPNTLTDAKNLCAECPHPTQATTREICRNFQRGHCTSGPRCRRLHVHGNITNSTTKVPTTQIKAPSPVIPPVTSLAPANSTPSKAETPTPKPNPPAETRKAAGGPPKPSVEKSTGSRDTPTHSKQPATKPLKVPVKSPEAPQAPGPPMTKSQDVRKSGRQGPRKTTQPTPPASTKPPQSDASSTPAPCADYQVGKCTNKDSSSAHVTPEGLPTPATSTPPNQMKPSMLPDPRGVKVNDSRAHAAYMVKLPGAPMRSTEGANKANSEVSSDTCTSSDASTPVVQLVPLRPPSPSRLSEELNQVSDLSSSVSSSAYATAPSHFDGDSGNPVERSVSSEVGNQDSKQKAASLPARPTNMQGTLPDNVCKHYALYRDCRFGRRCDFLHIRAEVVPILLTRSLEMKDAMREACVDHVLGRCGRGQNCVREHLDTSTVSLWTPNGICRAWMTGTCPRGNECPYDHEKLTWKECIGKLSRIMVVKKRTPNTPDGPSPNLGETHTEVVEPSVANGSDSRFVPIGKGLAPGIMTDDQRDPIVYQTLPNPPPPPYQPHPNSIWHQVMAEFNKPAEPPPQYPPGLPSLPVKEPPKPIPVLADAASHEPSQEKLHMTFTVENHMKVRLSSGFNVEHVLTGFETCKTIVENVPALASAEQIRALGLKHGSVTNVAPLSHDGTYILCYSSPEEALRAAASINGSQLLGRTLVSHIAFGQTSVEYRTQVRDTMVRIDWEVPHRTAYVGFDELETAQKAIAKLHYLEIGGMVVSASWYCGLPAVRNHNLRVCYLPPNASTAMLKRILGESTADEVMWDPPNYEAAFQATKNYIKTLLTESGDLEEFEVQQPIMHGWARGWARFPSTSTAQRAARYIGNRKPLFMGKSRITSRHINSVEYVLRQNVFEEAAADVEFLRKQAWENGLQHQLSLYVLPQKILKNGHGAPTRRVRLSATDKRELMKLKASFEIAIYGEVLRDKEEKIVWESYFHHPAAADFCNQLQLQYPGVRIRLQHPRQTIRIFGPLDKRALAKEALLKKVTELRQGITRRVPINRHATAFFLQNELPQLLRSTGPDLVTLLLWEQVVAVRGDIELYEKVLSAVRRAEQQGVNTDVPEAERCTVCFDRAVRPLQLSCGHLYCVTCLEKYIFSAADNKTYPVRCLGNDASCSELISLQIARQVLDPSQFESVTKGALQAHVLERPKEFYFCPTPDCEQVYRHGPQDTFIQCPSCTVRICPACHVEYHEGVLCRDYDEVGDKAFAVWAKEHGVKNCPGCKAPIEKMDGCNHMTCSRCQTHICWVCMETFPHGEGIYVHLRAKHGGFGIVDGIH